MRSFSATFLQSSRRLPLPLPKYPKVQNLPTRPERAIPKLLIW
jgi:hypothetical protein